MNEELILQPYYYILKNDGKKIRTKIIHAFNHWLKISDDNLALVSKIVDKLHNASLLIDDIEDDSLLRRGNPTAHQLFGIAPTINSANYVYFLSLEMLAKELPPNLALEAVKIFSQQLLELHEGQGKDIHWRESMTCPTEDEYIKMIQQKTGGLFGLGVHLMKLFSQDKRDYTKIITILGTIFQIRDDYANLKSEEYAENKTFAEDLTEGKFSFPIVHAIRTHPDDQTIMNIVRRRTKDVEIKQYAVKLMDKLGSLDYTLNYLSQLDSQAREECQRLGDNLQMMQLLDLLKMKEK